MSLVFIDLCWGFRLLCRSGHVIRQKETQPLSCMNTNLSLSLFVSPPSTFLSPSLSLYPPFVSLSLSCMNHARHPHVWFPCLSTVNHTPQSWETAGGRIGGVGISRAPWRSEAYIHLEAQKPCPPHPSCFWAQEGTLGPGGEQYHPRAHWQPRHSLSFSLVEV